MTICDKPFKTYDEQIELLKSRGLIIEDYEFALHALNTISYYDLINRYQRYFMPDGEKFIDNTRIELLYSFSLFDKSIQSFILKYSMFIENIFKTKLAYILAKDFGAKESEYLSAAKYRQSYQNPNGTLTFNSISLECEKTILDSKITNNPTLYYHENHNHIPPWILLKNLSFSNAINLFKLLKDTQRDIIVNELIPNAQITPSDKINFVFCSLEAIRLFRNFAAHNLDFTALRTDETRKLSPTVISKLLSGSGLIKKENKKISATERSFFRGIYGIMLSMLVYLKTNYLISEFIIDFLSIFKGINGDDAGVKYYLFECYSDIANMPIDTPIRLQNYLFTCQQKQLS